ncbi:MAG: sulfite exporter TauE/SafE family protein [Proteobacteria bacterium]|nr:sulfite exporter TauE/SafE family protein [Pseudomonadota bacterium]
MLDFLLHVDPLYVLSGILVGGLVGMTGVGGGSLMTPILVLLFGMHPATAVGTDLIYASLTKASGSIVHGYNRTVDWRVVGRLALGSIPATALTIAALYFMDVDGKATQLLITRVLGFALLFTAFSLLIRKPLMRWYMDHVPEMHPDRVRKLTILTGATLGVLVSLSSVGAGAIGVTALVFLYPKMEARRIVGSDIAHAVPLTLIAGLGHASLGLINWHVLSSLLVGSIPAIIVMSIVSARASDTAVRVTLAIVLIAVCIRFWFA